MSHDTTHPYSPKNTIYDFRTEILNCQGSWIRTNVMRFSLSSGELKSSRLLHSATLPHLEN